MSIVQAINEHKWLDERKPSDGFEPDWESYVQASAERAYDRIYMMSFGRAIEVGEIRSPAMVAIIAGEMRKLVNELTENWN